MNEAISMKDQLVETFRSLVDGIIQLAPKVLVGIVLLLVALVVAKIIEKVLRTVLKRVIGMNHNTITRPQLPCQLGKQHDANCNPNDTKRQLIEPIRVVEIRHGACLQRRDDCTDNDIDLGDAARNQAGYAELDQALHAGRV